jgi:DNA-directed RNA polymerase subunit beta'
VGGTASNIAAESNVYSRYDGIALKLMNLRTVDRIEDSGRKLTIVISRLAELRIIDKNTNIVLTTHNVPYGSKLYKSRC